MIIFINIGSELASNIHSDIEPLCYVPTHGVFPDELKLAKVLPIFKSDNVQLIQNHRPTSVLPYFSKFFEKLVSKYIESNILYDNQYGFRTIL